MGLPGAYFGEGNSNRARRWHAATFRCENALTRMAGTTGLEPATSAVTGQRSNQLNYVPTPILRVRNGWRHADSARSSPHENFTGSETTKYIRSRHAP
jgi:hypothetical protein